MTDTGWNRVMCLETAGYQLEEFGDMASVRPLLELLRTQQPDFDFVHRTVATKVDLLWHLAEWRSFGEQYFLYLAFHGDKGLISMPNGDEVTIDELADHLRGGLEGCIVHFGSCLVIEHDEDPEARAFLRKTGAKAVMGYSTEIDWIPSAAHDLFLLAQGSRRDALSRMAQAAETESLRKQLGFHLVRARR